MTNITIKAIFIGDFYVGKTMIIKKIIDKFSIDEHCATIGVDIHTKDINVNDTKIKVYMYDCAGQERYANLINLFYKYINICYIVYDASEPSTFKNILYWKREILKYNDNVIFVLIANKIDKQRYISTEEGLQFSKNNDMIYYELSATKPAIDITYILTEPIKKLLQNNDINHFCDIKINVPNHNDIKKTSLCFCNIL